MDIKRLIHFGAVWILSGNKKKRLRRNDYHLSSTENAILHFDAKILDQIKNRTNGRDEPVELFNFKTWGIWFKPAGYLSQGSPFGDLWSVQRFVEKKYKTAHLIHRLDLEVSGLLVLAYNSNSASSLSRIWNERQLEKYYLAKVLGITQEKGWHTISKKVEEKESETKFQTLRFENNISLIEINLLTGRKHQIRIHLESIGHPIIGDPRYGKKNKNSEGLCLQAYKLKLKGPGMTKMDEFVLPEKYLLFSLK